MNRKDSFEMYIIEIFKGYDSKWKFEFKKEKVYLWGPNNEMIAIIYEKIITLSYEKDEDFGTINIKTSGINIEIEFHK